jgi:hypothetical protein
VLHEDATIIAIKDRAKRIEIHFTEKGRNGFLAIPKPPTTNARINKLQTKSKSGNPNPGTTGNG